MRAKGAATFTLSVQQSPGHRPLRARRIALQRARRAALAVQERARVAARLAARRTPQPRAPGHPQSAPTPRPVPRPVPRRVLKAPPAHDASAARAAYQRKQLGYAQRRANAAHRPHEAAPLPLP